MSKPSTRLLAMLPSTSLVLNEEDVFLGKDCLHSRYLLVYFRLQSFARYESVFNVPASLVLLERRSFDAGASGRPSRKIVVLFTLASFLSCDCSLIEVLLADAVQQQLALDDVVCCDALDGDSVNHQCRVCYTLAVGVVTDANLALRLVADICSFLLCWLALRYASTGFQIFIIVLSAPPSAC